MSELDNSPLETTDGDNVLPPRPALTVVGIGASAGGLQALRQLCATIPAESDLVFVAVVHLAPESESHLADLLQPFSAVPVAQISDDAPLERNQVYVIPPGRNLSVVDSHLRLTPLEKDRRERAPIDKFLRALSETYDGSSVGVILSGTGSDGAVGIQYVRDQGGMTIAQDPQEAEYDAMPRRAIETGLVDRVLPIAQIVPAIIEFARTKPQVPEVAAAVTDPDGPDQFERVLTLVRLRTGHDFSRYKKSSIGRRIARRMQILNLEHLNDYVTVLRDRADEVVSLMDDLLINVTNFFRDPTVFQSIETHLVPKLFDGKGPDDRVRVWSVGCATGEEAYSIAMLLHEEAGRRPRPPAVQVFASDLHERSLRIAREALYPDSIEMQISAERLDRFFQPEPAGYRVRKSLRDTVVFAAHNLLRDPPFSKLDLVICRNVLIYLQRDLQHEVIGVFHYALRSDGFLLLGTAETLEHSDRFRAEDAQQHLYRRREVPKVELNLPGFPIAQPPYVALPREASRIDGASYGHIHQTIVERFAPPSLLINNRDDVVHMSEHVGRYLQHTGGEPTTNVFRLVREELRVELRATLLTTNDRGRSHRSGPVAIDIGGETRYVTIRATPAAQDDQLDGFRLVIFDEAEASSDHSSAEPRTGGATAAELETELGLTKHRLTLVVEEFETSRHEMRAANEELQSSNEELRSTMEELETSREELQSVNEELQTLNQENKHRVEELSQLSNDLQNLLQATNVATLFLDRNLRIVRFTPPVGEIFNIRHTDRGRPLADLTHRLGYDGLLDDAKRVLQTLVPIDAEVESPGWRWHLLRVTPYRTTDDRIDGVVITFVDVTGLKRTESALRESEQRFRLMADGSPLMIWVHDADGRARLINRGFAEFHGVTIDDVAGDEWRKLLHPADTVDYLDRYFAAVASLTDFHAEARMRRADGAWRLVESFARPEFDASHGLAGFTGTNVDVTERHQREMNIALLVEIYDELSSSSPSAHIITAVGDRVATHFAATRLTFVELDSSGKITEMLYDSAGGDLTQEVGNAGPLRFTADPWRDQRAGRITAVDNIATDPRLAGQADDYAARNIGALLIAPYSSNGPLTFVIVIEYTQPHAWTPAEIDLLRDIAAQFYPRLLRARSEEALRASEAQFRLIVASARDYAIMTVSVDARIESWSPGAEMIFGYSEQDIVGKDYSVLFVPEDAASGAPLRELTAASALELVPDVRWHQRKDRRRIFMDGTTRALRDEDGHLRGFLKIGQEVTHERQMEQALRDSEARYRRLVESVRDYAIFLLDANGVISEWTTGAEFVMGYSADEAAGLHISKLYTPEAVDDGEPARDLAQAAASGSAEREGWRVRKNGTRLWVDEIVTAIVDTNGTVAGYSRIARDLTERRLVEAAAARAREEQERNAVRAQLATAEEEERRRLALELHDEAGQHLTALSLGLQALSDITQPGSEVDRRAAQLRTLTDSLGREIHALAVRLRPRVLDDFGLEAALQSYAEEWSRWSNIEIDVHATRPSERLPVAVENAIYRIAQEALTNVARHSGATRASLIVERRDGHLHAVIEDNGRGFDVAALEAMPVTGRGIGLVGIRERVALLGGSIEVETAPAGGTAILVRIPVKAAR